MSVYFIYSFILFADEQMTGVVEIMQQREPAFCTDPDNIVIEFEEVKPATLRAMEAYVKDCLNGI